MSTANFHDRIERIQRAHAQAPVSKPVSFRTKGAAGVAASQSRLKLRRRTTLRDHILSLAFGVVLGALVAVALIGLSMEGTLWGPGTVWHDIAYYPTMAGLGLSPVLMLVSLFTAARRPGFALFSLGYLSGIAVPLMI